MEMNANERDTRPATAENADIEETVKALKKLSFAARQRIFGAVKYAEMVEVEMGEQANASPAAAIL